MEKCRSCGAEIVWLRHEKTGKLAPIEVGEVENGNIIAYAKGEYRIVSKGVMEEARAVGVRLRINHFARCGQAESFRRS